MKRDRLLAAQDRGENPGAVFAWAAVMLLVWAIVLFGAAVLS